jgi:hypothetical protein
MTNREIAFGCAGIAIGAFIVGFVWATLGWPPVPLDYTAFYDRCLAAGNSKTACDTAARIAVAEDKKAKSTRVGN